MTNNNCSDLTHGTMWHFVLRMMNM